MINLFFLRIKEGVIKNYSGIIGVNSDVRRNLDIGDFNRGVKKNYLKLCCLI